MEDIMDHENNEGNFVPEAERLQQDGYPASWSKWEDPTDEAALTHAEILVHPPKFEKVQHLLQNAPSYTNIPKPVPQQGKFDAKMAILERKLAAAMQYHVRGLDEPKAGETDFLASIALVRSAFEDVRQYRRQDEIKGIKNKEAVLPPRCDDDRVTLLSQAEKKLANAQRAREAAASKFKKSSDHYRQGNGKGKGGGKGKGKGNRGRSSSRTRPDPNSTSASSHR